MPFKRRGDRTTLLDVESAGADGSPAVAWAVRRGSGGTEVRTAPAMGATVARRPGNEAFHRAMDTVASSRGTGRPFAGARARMPPSRRPGR